MVSFLPRRRLGLGSIGQWAGKMKVGWGLKIGVVRPQPKTLTWREQNNNEGESNDDDDEHHTTCSTPESVKCSKRKYSQTYSTNCGHDLAQWGYAPQCYLRLSGRML